MTEDDKAFLKEFLQRSGVVGIVVGLFILFIAFLSYKQDPPIESQSTKVVAEYKYFLHCNNTRPVYEQ